MTLGAENAHEGATVGAEEAHASDTNVGASGTDGSNAAVADGSSAATADDVERWQDLDPTKYHPTLRGEVEKLNKAAVSQFQRKVQRLAESGKLTKQQLEEIGGKYSQAQGLIETFVSNPEAFVKWHQQAFPQHAFWKRPTGNQQQGPSEQDAQALALLEQAGVVTQDKLNKIVSPLVQKLQAAEAKEQQRLEAESNQELSDFEKWCGENKYPCTEPIQRACIALIGQGHATTMKEAFELVGKPLVEAAAQMNLTRKANGQTANGTVPGNNVIANESLRDTITRIVKQRSKA